MSARLATVGQTRTQSTIDTIRAMIVRGELRPGDRLQAQMLADRLGVSRTPIADALAALHQEGLLEYEPNRGYEVKRIDLAGLMAAFDVRLTLEGLACRLVVEKGLRADRSAQLRENLKQTEQVLFGQTWSAVEQDLWRDLNLQFHDALIAEAGNPYLAAGVANCRVPPLIYDQALRQIDTEEVRRHFSQLQAQQAFRDHERIFEALIAGQSARAENMMKEHIFANREKARRHVEMMIAERTPNPAVV